MEEILKTEQLEFEKSTFLIDLAKHNSGSLYVEITQIINGDNINAQLIKINPSVLTDLIRVLQNYHAIIPKNTDRKTKHLTESDQQKIQDRYLKGVSLNELALQFNQFEELIESVLRNRGIEIVPNEIPKRKFWRRRRK